MFLSFLQGLGPVPVDIASFFRLGLAPIIGGLSVCLGALEGSERIED